MTCEEDPAIQRWLNDVSAACRKFGVRPFDYGDSPSDFVLPDNWNERELGGFMPCEELYAPIGGFVALEVRGQALVTWLSSGALHHRCERLGL